MGFFEHYRIYKIEKRLIRGFCRDIKVAWIRFWRRLDLMLARPSWRKLAKRTPVVCNQIMFRTYQDKYTCNPKYFCEALLRSDLDCQIVWAYSKKTGDLSQFPPQVRLVKFGSVEFYEAMAQSKFWVDNAHNFTWEAFPKKAEQVLINLWHGSLGLKRIDPDSDSNPARRRAGKLAGTSTTYCISDSDFEDMVFRTSYWPQTPFLRLGHARNDLMFADDDTRDRLRKKVYAALGIPEGKKLLLYAPTFRDNEDFACFNVDYPALKAALEERFGGEWVIASRLHMHTQLLVKRYATALGGGGHAFVYSADLYDDMQELVAVADAALTDYSSWICDFVLTGRPGFLFATDREEYVTERGFYYPLEDTPFPIAANNRELCERIRSFDEELYREKVKTYLDGLGCMEDGHACDRLVQLIRDEIAACAKE